MEAKNLYVLSGTENLMRGELDNVTIQDGHLRLDSVAGRYVLYGCYTSQPVSFPAFTRLIMSWNADTPNGTVVEAEEVSGTPRLANCPRIWWVLPVWSRTATLQSPSQAPSTW